MSVHKPVAHDADGRGGQDLLQAAHRMFVREPALSAILAVDLARVRTPGELLAAVLSGAMPAGPTRTFVHEMSLAVFSRHPTSLASTLADIAVTTQKNFEPAGEISTLLFSRGIHAVLAHRVAHALWVEGRTELSLALKTAFGRVFSTDIHPAARFGTGIWLDHGLGFVVGETAIIEDDVSIWHGVTLGSTLKVAGGSRHPRLRRGCTIGAGAIVLGGVEVGEGSVVAAGSVVLGDVAPFTTVAGVPAKAKPRSSGSFSGFPPKQEGMQ